MVSVERIVMVVAWYMVIVAGSSDGCNRIMVNNKNYRVSGE